MNGFEIESTIVYVGLFGLFIYMIVTFVSSAIKAFLEDEKKSVKIETSTNRKTSENPWWKGQERDTRPAQGPGSWRTQRRYGEKGQEKETELKEGTDSEEIIDRSASFQDGVRQMLGQEKGKEGLNVYDDTDELEDIPEWALDDESIGKEDMERADIVSKLFAKPESVVSGIIFSEVLGRPKSKR